MQIGDAASRSFPDPVLQADQNGRPAEAIDELRGDDAEDARVPTGWFYSLQDDQPETITETELLALIDRYNRDPKIHGILVQLPLPKHINETKVLCAIDPKKDVDGFHPVNVGKMTIGEADYLPCTPAGIQQLLIRSGVKTDGAEVVVVGRSNIVGKP
ncbi:MAG: tetrahydrofolate dehydrogenase/cyclohydrolase catalytic domain-containing protein, partial [Pseudomonadota bacterium]